MDTRTTDSYLAELVRHIQDFPHEGSIFKDITPILQSPLALRKAVDAMVDPFRAAGVEIVVGVESRGFIVGAPIAFILHAGFALIRRPNKLPFETVCCTYALEHGQTTLEIHRDAISQGQRILVVDDVLATGGTVRAAISLVERLGGAVVGLSFLLDLGLPGARTGLQSYPLHTVLE